MKSGFFTILLGALVMSAMVSLADADIVIEELKGEWVLIEAGGHGTARRHIGRTRLTIKDERMQFSLGVHQNAGSYRVEGDELVFTHSPRNEGTKQMVYKVAFEEDQLHLIETITSDFMRFARPDAVPFRVNSEQYDDRFATPEKTYAYFRQCLLDDRPGDAVEAMVPNRAVDYYQSFRMMGSKYDDFKYIFSEDIVFKRQKGDTHQYLIHMNMDGEKAPTLVGFTHFPSGIYLIAFF